MYYINGYPVSDVVLEAVTAMSNDQEPSERFRYRDVAFEAVLNPAGKSKMIQKLYTDILSKSDIDYGKIPLSKGDITKYENYDVLMKSIENLNNLLKDSNIEELTLTNRLHDMIVICRADFEFGFKFDIEFIKLTYNTLVLSLHEMVNMCIVAYVKYLKEVKEVDFKFNTTKKNDRIIIKSTRDFLKSYDNGEWTKLMLHFKKNSSNMLGMSTATIVGLASTVPAPLAMAGGVILGTIAILFTIRLLIYFVYSSSTKLSQYVKLQSEFLRVSVNNSMDNSASSTQMQKNMLSGLEGISSFIDTKILKTEKDMAKELKLSNSTNFTTQELKDTSDTTGFELL